MSIPNEMNKEEKTACREKLRAAARKHIHNKHVVNRLAGAAEIIDPSLGSGRMWFRQGQIAGGTPGHIIYWIQSGGDYNQHPNDVEHTTTPPFYCVRLGDDHDCDCEDMKRGRRSTVSDGSNGAPKIGEKHYCKHVFAAFTLEWLRNNPVRELGRDWIATQREEIQATKNAIRNETEFYLWAQRAQEAGISPASLRTGTGGIISEFMRDPAAYITAHSAAA
jgi:hypothetical protein